MADPSLTATPAPAPCPECGGECVRAQTVLGSFGVQGTGGYLAGATADSLASMPPTLRRWCPSARKAIIVRLLPHPDRASALGRHRWR
jgi:hypothetical protein